MMAKRQAAREVDMSSFLWRKSARWAVSNLVPFALAAATLIASYFLMHAEGSRSSYFPWHILFRHFFLAGIILQLLILGLRVSRSNFPYFRGVLVGIVISASIAALLTADSWQTPQAVQPTQAVEPETSTRADGPQPATPPTPAGRQHPGSFANLLYILIVERPALMGLALLALGGLGAAVYFIFRLLMPVEYTGSGIQIRLPGHAVHYLPIFPQVSWNETGIELRKGEKVTVELYGWVSPGGLHGLNDWERFTDKLVLYEKRHLFPDRLDDSEKALLKEYDEKLLEEYKNRKRPEEYAGLVAEYEKEGFLPPKKMWPSWEPTWPYWGPEGYPKEFYRDTLGVLRTHPLYKYDDFYEDDFLLTVQGCPHLQVFGIVLAPGEVPNDTKLGKTAYNWNHPPDREQLLCLSSKKYPIEVEAQRSGQLWVVVNDVDEARWDNVGLFFMKLTRRQWL
jgi:hypothetical protein